MIQKLKACCGYSYTNKLQRMLQDIRISEDLRLKFQMQAGEKNILKVSHLITSQYSVNLEYTYIRSWYCKAGLGLFKDAQLPPSSCRKISLLS